MGYSTLALPWQTRTLVYVGYSCLLTPSEVRVNPRQEFFGHEWFRDEVVCPGLETGTLGCSISFSAQQQHGHVAEKRIRQKLANKIEFGRDLQTDAMTPDV